MSALPASKRIDFEKKAGPTIHVWCPDIFGAKGGISVFSQFLLKAICDWNPKVNCRILLKNDIPNRHSNINGNHRARFHYTGHWPGILRTSAYSAKLLGFGVAERPDLVIVAHLHFGTVANILRRLKGIPYWTMAYGVEAWGIERRKVRTALHNADRIFAISEYTRKRLLIEQSLNAKKVSLLACTFDPEQFVIASKPPQLLGRYNLTAEQPIILTVSRLVTSEQYKGYDSILRAMPQIRRAIPGIRYLIVGQGDDRPRIERLIEELGIRDCIILAGYVPDDELCDYYNLCDVFAMPSKREGFGIVYLEAMSCGKPVLGGNKDGAIDALCHGELGALVDPDDIEKITSTLIEILRGTYSLPLMYKPEDLRAKVIDIYGYNRFRQTLKMHLDNFFGAQS